MGNNEGLALVQIRAYASERRRKRLWAPTKPAPAGNPAAKPHWIEQLLTELLDRIIIGVHALSTPFRSFFCARQWSMSYRNDEQVSLLGETFNIRYESGEGVNWKCLDRSHRREKNGWFEILRLREPALLRDELADHQGRDRRDEKPLPPRPRLARPRQPDPVAQQPGSA